MDTAKSAKQISKKRIKKNVHCTSVHSILASSNLSV